MIPEDISSHLHYDEQVAIETYVLRNFAHLLSDEERAVLDGGLARWWDENLERMHEWGARARSATVAPPWEPAPFDEPHAEQVRAIVRRLRADHPALEFARCHHCGRIVRGPADPVCPWCRTPFPTSPPAA
jgi:rubrerythrin